MIDACCTQAYFPMALLNGTTFVLGIKLHTQRCIVDLTKNRDGEEDFHVGKSALQKYARSYFVHLIASSYCFILLLLAYDEVEGLSLLGRRLL
jgi:hypothetical protein